MQRHVIHLHGCIIVDSRIHSEEEHVEPCTTTVEVICLKFTQGAEAQSKFFVCRLQCCSQLLQSSINSRLAARFNRRRLLPAPCCMACMYASLHCKPACTLDGIW
jgi:hypothetical protein